MTIVRVGTNQKYAAGWETAFGGKRKKKAKSVTAKKSATAKAKKTTKTTKSAKKKSRK